MEKDEPFELNLSEEEAPQKDQTQNVQNQKPQDQTPKAKTKSPNSGKSEKKEKAPISKKKIILMLALPCLVAIACFYLLNGGFEDSIKLALDEDRLYEKLPTEDRKLVKEATKKFVASTLKKGLKKGSLNEKELKKDIEQQISLAEKKIDAKKIPPSKSKQKIALDKPKVQAASPESKPTFDLSDSPTNVKDPIFKLGENHYFTIPHQLEAKSSFERRWTPTEESEFLEGINSTQPWKRWQTVHKARDLHLSGSEDIFWQTLGDDSFWTRMEALTGLAEFGVPVSWSIVEHVFEDIKPRLIRNYLKRFWSKPSEGEMFVLRQALALVEEKTRLLILKIIYKYAPKKHDLFFVAALQDHSQEIRKFAVNAMKHWPQEKTDSLGKKVEALLQGKHLGLKGVGFPEAYQDLEGQSKVNEVGLTRLQFYDKK